MNRLAELTQKLTPAELKQVEDLARSLAARHTATNDETGERKIRFDGWAGCLSHVHPEMSDKEFKDLMLDERAKAGED